MTSDQQTPPMPYVGYGTFDNFLNSLRDSTIPTRIDRSYLKGTSYGTQAALLASLRYLGLIRDDKAPTEKLEGLALASDEERPVRLQALLREAYPFLWNGSIDLQRTTADEMRERFGDQTSIRGSTLDKAIAFFCSAADAAKVDLSPHLKPRAKGGRPRSSGGTGRQRATRQKRQSRRSGNQMTQNTVSQTAPTFEGQLLNKFPEFDPAWPDELKAQWFEGFKTLMEMAPNKDGEPS